EADGEDERNGQAPARALQRDRHRRAADRHQEIGLQRHQLLRQTVESREVAVGPAELELDVAALDEAVLLQPVLHRLQQVRVGGKRAAAEIADQRWPLGAHRSARDRGEAGRHEEASLDHSISSSARARKDCEKVRPSSRAVRMLTTSSKRVGCSTGRSPGLAPFRILATKPAERRYMSAKLGPYDIRPPARVKVSTSQIDGRRCWLASPMMRSRWKLRNGEAIVTRPSAP